ncbi:MAG: glycosyltransferase family 4 protein [Polyangiaceae bacterium]
MTMRIALVTTSWPDGRDAPGGHFVRTEARALEQAGHEVVLITPPTGGAFGWPGVPARIRERPLRAVEVGLWVGYARHRLHNLTSVHRTVAHWAIPSAWPIGVSTRGALDVVSHGGDIRLLAALPARARRFVVHAIASRARVWRFVSETLLSDLLRALDTDARTLVARIAIVEPAALDVPDVSNQIERIREEIGLRRVAVCVARLVPSKRVERAIEHVAESRTFDMLVIVGDGPERSALERLARRRSVDARFVGLVPRTVALSWIGAADALLHASNAEGASTVVREAHMLGTAVVIL